MAAHAELIGWAASTLGSDAVEAKVIAETPYSTVIRIMLDGATYYLKRTPPDLFIEAAVITACRDLCGITAIPEIIALNPQLNCFLMRSCGDTSLRRICGGNTERIDVKPDGDLTLRALRLYCEMQQATAPHVADFISLGVPTGDWKSLPDIYRRFVADTAMLQEYGLDEAQIGTLRALADIVVERCRTLSAFGISACINLSDLHDDNMLLDMATGAISIIDWGESTIEHPLLSLATAFGRLHGRYRIEAGLQLYQKLYDACFGGWGLADDEQANAVALATDLSWFVWVLSYQRLEQAAGRQAMVIADKTNDRIKDALLKFMSRMIAT